MLKIIVHLLVLSTIHNSNALKILVVFSTPSMDPDGIYKTLIQELAERGHEITLVTVNAVFPEAQSQENITEIDLHESSHRIWIKYRNIITSDQNIDSVSKIKFALHTANHAFEQLLKTDEIKNLIEEKHSNFDLLFLEAGVMPLLSFSNIFKAPVILVSSEGALEHYEDVGAPTHPFLYPSIFRRRLYNLTTWEKISEMYMHIRLELTLRSNEKKCNLMLKKHFGSTFPSLNELKNNVHALFLNTNPIWEGNRPVPLNVVFIGGIQPKITDELPQDVLSFINKSEHGVICVSFGNTIKPSTLPPNKILKILNVLSITHYDVLLRWDVERLPGVPKNIKIYKWLRQSSLLKHPKIKLLITQAGLQSTYDAIFAGVPLIGIPIYSDQWYHAEKYIHFRIGTQLDIASLTEEKLIDAINLVLSDENYRRNIADLRTLMYDHPQSSLQRAIWWTEYILRHGGAQHQRSPAANMSWAEYYEQDLVLSLIFILFLTTAVLIVFTTLLLRYIIMSFKDVKKEVI